MDCEKKCCEACVILQEKDREIEGLRIERDALADCIRMTNDAIKNMNEEVKQWKN